jgi:hypothetical protein
MAVFCRARPCTDLVAARWLHILDKERFTDSFSAHVDAEKAAFMTGSQVPWRVGALEGVGSEPASKTKPNWYLVANHCGHRSIFSA